MILGFLFFLELLLVCEGMGKCYWDIINSKMSKSCCL